MFIDLDYTKEVPKPKLFLAKPNGNIISPINDIEILVFSKRFFIVIPPRIISYST